MITQHVYIHCECYRFISVFVTQKWPLGLDAICAKTKLTSLHRLPMCLWIHYINKFPALQVLKICTKDSLRTSSSTQF